ncbi:MAG: menaquinone-dependent protoporphyrinogen IX dehydrogenase [Parashewanella sp.]
MQKILVIYSTVDGQTKLICDRMHAIMCLEANIEMVALERAGTVELNDYDKVLIGASIRYGKYRPQLFDFIERNKELLASKYCGFFSVNVVARKPNKNLPETNPYMKAFVSQSPWQPQQLAVFAGRIDYPKYKWFDRTMIRFIMWMTKGPTDLAECYEFTDWQQVESFSKAFIDVKI